jgi:hypothetical protein
MFDLGPFSCLVQDPADLDLIDGSLYAPSKLLHTSIIIILSPNWIPPDQCDFFRVKEHLVSQTRHMVSRYATVGT